MLNISSAFKKKLYNDERNYINRLEITLANGTQLSVDNEHIMSSSGVELDDAVSEDETFSALGATIINSVTFVLYNNDEIYSDYDFKNAEIVYYVGLNVDTIVNNEPTTILEEIKKGTFTVDDATFSQATVTLYALDYMEQFDRPYSTSTLVYPATLAEIVRDACYHCLGSVNDLETQQFPHYTYQIQNRPSDEATTYREVIGYAAAVAGCFARCNVNGKLELKWFDVTTLYDTSNDLDGGTFNPWTAGNEISGGTFNPWTTGTSRNAGEFTPRRTPHYVTYLWSADIAVDDVVITGVSAIIEARDPNDPDGTIEETILKGTADYVVAIEENPFITESNVNEILEWLKTQLVGLTFRKCSVTHQSDPSIEAGDIGYVWDTKGIEHPILITRVTFAPGSPQTIVCGASTPSRNSASRFSQLTKSFVKNRKLLKQAQNPYAKALQTLAEAVNSATGLYETTVTDQSTGTTITYRHNQPILAESNIVQMISSAGVTFTTNYLDTTPVWYGFAFDGSVVANQISALGINFEWAVGTILTLGGANNGNGVLRVVDANGDQIGIWTNTGLVLSQTRDKNTTSERTFETYIGNCYTLNNYNLGGYYYFTNNGLGNTDAMLKDENDNIVALHTIIPEKRGAVGDGADTAPGIREAIYCSGGGAYKKLFTNETMSDDGGLGIAQTYSGQEEWRRDDKFVMRHSAYTNSSSPSSDWYLNISDSMFFYDNAFHNIWNTYVTGTVHFKISTAMIDIRGGEYSLKIDQYGNLLNGNIIQTTSSSKRYKHNISEDICEKLDPHKLYKLKMKQFVYNEDHEPPYACMIGKTLPGFIAEDIDEVYPSAVIKNKDGEIESWSEAQIIAPMLSLIQEQKQEIDDLKERVEKLEKLIAEKLL